MLVYQRVIPTFRHISPCLLLNILGTGGFHKAALGRLHLALDLHQVGEVFHVDAFQSGGYWFDHH